MGVVMTLVDLEVVTGQTDSPVLYWYTSTGLLYISAMACISMWLPWQLFFLFLLMYVVKSSVT